MPGFVISKKAVEDIDGIWLYTARNWSVEQADRYYNLIFDEIEFVAKYFESAADFGHIRPGYRYSKVKSHLIFFRKTTSSEIEVVRVLHERMDIDHRISE